MLIYDLFSLSFNTIAMFIFVKMNNHQTI